MKKSKNYILYGRRTVQEYLRTDFAAEALAEVLLSPTIKREEFSGIEKLPGAKIKTVQRDELDREYPELNHQGVLLCFQTGRTPHEKEYNAKDVINNHDGLLVALDDIQDSQNCGSIIRSAEALGARGIFLCGQSAKLNPAIDRVSSGATFHLPIFQNFAVHNLIKSCNSAERWIVTSSGHNPGELKSENSTKTTRHQPLYLSLNEREKLPPGNSSILIIGSEGSGVRQSLLQRSDFVVTIPLHGKIESLNAGVAAGILIQQLVSLA